MLLELGAPHAVWDRDHKTPLDLAEGAHLPEAARLLREAAAGRLTPGALGGVGGWVGGSGGWCLGGWVGVQVGGGEVGVACSNKGVCMAS